MPIDRNVFDKCLVDANEDIRDAQKALDPSDRYLSEQYDVTVDGENDYNFNSKTVFLNAYLIGKLNTSLHDKTVSVEHTNGFEVYRQICQIMDAVLENAKFHMTNELSNMVKTHGGKVVGGKGKGMDKKDIMVWKLPED